MPFQMEESSKPKKSSSSGNLGLILVDLERRSSFYSYINFVGIRDITASKKILAKEAEFQRYAFCSQPGTFIDSGKNDCSNFNYRKVNMKTQRSSDCGTIFVEISYQLF